MATRRRRLRRNLQGPYSNRLSVPLKCKRKRWILPRRKRRHRPPQNARHKARILSLILRYHGAAITSERRSIPVLTAFREIAFLQFVTCEVDDAMYSKK